jgi:hypothetical protein
MVAQAIGGRTHHKCAVADHIRLTQKPRIHNVRPAIDPCSAARPTEHGSWESFSAGPAPKACSAYEAELDH